MLNMQAILFGLAILQSISHAVGGSGFREGTPTAFINGMNLLRANFARKNQIANMNELILEPEYVKLIAENAWLEEEHECRKPQLINSYGVEVLVNVNEDDELIYYLISEPDRQKIGCIRSICPKTGKEVYTCAVDSPNAAMIIGDPGSQCPENKPLNNKGLCSSRPSNEPRRSSGYVRKGLFDSGFDPEDFGIPDCFGMRAHQRREMERMEKEWRENEERKNREDEFRPFPFGILH